MYSSTEIPLMRAPSWSRGVGRNVSDDGLPVRMLGKYFVKEGEDWRVARSIRDGVKFRVFNLLDSFESLGEFVAA